MALIITYDEKEYHFDKEAITIDEWRELKRKYRMTPKQFDDTIGQADPDASTFLYWVMLRQAGDHRVPLGDDLKPDIIALNKAIANAITGQPPEDDPDPTPAGSRPATTRSAGSSKATSTSSAASTSSSSPATAGSPPPTSDG